MDDSAVGDRDQDGDAVDDRAVDDRAVDDVEARMSIGAFARRVGLAPSALRFYDDCGVLRPASVDGGTGYRYYAPSQVRRATLLRRLRAAGLPLIDAVVVLDGPAQQARALLTEHARQARESAARTQATIEDLLHQLPKEGWWTRVALGGPELASAVRQVARAVAPDPVRASFPVLGCVLIEVDREEMRLVATDRYQLAVRTLRPDFVDGEPCQVLVAASEIAAAASWVKGAPDIRLEVNGDGVRLGADGRERIMAVVDGSFPDYRLLLDGLPPVRHRIIASRAAIGSALGADAPAVLAADRDRLTIGSTVLPAICTGPPVRVAFDPARLGAVLESSVGPDILLEIASPTEPVRARSADQGSFATLLMPVRA